MNLPAPDLDSRRFQDLVAEARARIPSYTPEWTNLNESDPGMALVQLHAWLTETILHELNRVPDLNYVKFLDLLGITPRPAHAARTELTFTLEKLEKRGDPLVVDVPIRTKVAVDDPQLPAEIIFETDRSLRALNAHIGAVLAYSGQKEHPHALVTRYDEGLTWLHGFRPFDPQLLSPGAHDAAPPLYIGLLLRPWMPTGQTYAEDRLPAGPLDLYMDAVQVHDTDAQGKAEDVPGAMTCREDTAARAPVRRITWQIYTGGYDGASMFSSLEADAPWTGLGVSHDDSHDLSRSGHLVLEIPTQATPIAPDRLDQTWWDSFGHPQPPRTRTELINLLNDPKGPADLLPGLADFWQKMGVSEEDRAALEACGESVTQTVEKLKELTDAALDPAALTFSDWVEVSEEFAVAMPQQDNELRPMYWLRARVTTPFDVDEPQPAVLGAIRLGTVPATQASTRIDDGLGRSTGRPGQTFTLPRTPVLVHPDTLEPDLELRVGNDVWERRADFYGSGPDDRHYLLDPGTGTITLGDGERGRTPVADTQVTAARYRTGGGELGNVPAGTISKIKGRIHHVRAVTNHRAAHDGSDTEPLDHVKLRAPHDLRVRDRAVTAADFADLALRTPGVALHRAYALGRRAPRPGDGLLVDRDGAVTLVVLPSTTHSAPMPTEAQLRAVCRWLEPRRLITTELHVVGPQYTQITKIAARITVAGDHDLATVSEAVHSALLTYFHPVRGGDDGTGWQFGEDIYHGAVYDVLLAVPGVRRVSGLTVAVAGSNSSPPDVTPLAEGHLPQLVRDRIHVVTGYE